MKAILKAILINQETRPIIEKWFRDSVYDEDYIDYALGMLSDDWYLLVTDHPDFMEKPDVTFLKNYKFTGPENPLEFVDVEYFETTQTEKKSTMIKSESVRSCEGETLNHILNHNEIIRLKTIFKQTEKKETNMFKAILVSKSNHDTVRKLTGLDPRHIENKVIVVIEKNPGLGLVEVIQRWVFDKKYVFTEQPSPHHLVEIEAR